MQLVGIRNGPSKYDLMLALFEGRTVEFKTSCGKSFEVKVKSIECLVSQSSDEPREYWRLKICCKDIPEDAVIYFSTKNRFGTLNSVNG